MGEFYKKPTSLRRDFHDDPDVDDRVESAFQPGEEHRLGVKALIGERVLECFSAGEEP